VLSHHDTDLLLSYYAAAGLLMGHLSAGSGHRGPACQQLQVTWPSIQALHPQDRGTVKAA